MTQPTVKYAFVDTPLGTGLVAARGDRVVASALPGRHREDHVARLRERFPDAAEAPESDVAGAAELRAWCEGRGADPAAVAIDLGGVPEFAARVYRALRRVRRGKTTTYGDLARRAGSPGAARAVGTAMARNPLAPFVPCHRVLGSDGALRGFSAPGGTATKARYLALEFEGAAGDGANP